MDTTGTPVKTCNRCGVTKLVTDFYRTKNTKDGRIGTCRPCVSPNPDRYRPRNAPGVVLSSKVCTQCRQDKPLDQFTPGDALFGRVSRCRPCLVEVDRVRRHTRREQIKASARAYALRNTEKIAARRKAEYQRNSQYHATKSAAWVRANPIANRLRRARRRARLANAEGTFTVAEWLSLLAGYGGKCLACGSRERIELDHVIPLARGGTNWITNIQPLCRSCNSSKKEKSTDYRPRASFGRAEERDLLGDWFATVRFDLPPDGLPNGITCYDYGIEKGGLPT